jgi:hypothetical protein
VNPEPVLRHSRDFVLGWKEVLRAVFGWEQAGEFLRVRSLTGRSTLSYLPLLNYTDLDPDGARELVSAAAGENYLIRVLDGSATEFQDNDPVCLRVPLQGRSEDEVWSKSLKSRTRSRVRKCREHHLETRIGNDPAIIADFHQVYFHTMHRLGAPAVPRLFLDLLAQRLGLVGVVVYLEGKPVAGLVAVLDRELFWVPYIGSLSEYWDRFTNYQVYWDTIREGLRLKARYVDFGRSPYGGTHYQFKRQWGAQPVRVRLLQPGTVDVYSRYSLAQGLWRRLPSVVAGYLGPKLVRHLADY